MAGAEELTATTLVAIEQAAANNGNFEVGYLLSLLEDLSQTLFMHRPAAQNPWLRAFGGLCPQSWATTTLAFIQEVDAIQTRRQEATKSKQSGEPRRLKPGRQAESSSPSPLSEETKGGAVERVEGLGHGVTWIYYVYMMLYKHHAPIIPKTLSHPLRHPKP